MATSKQALRSRIKSVNSTRKITKAMEMIANAKLFKQRNAMEANREYSERLQETVNEIVARNPDVDEVFITRRSENPKKFTIVFCSDLGLCGGYNSAVLKMARETLKPEDPMILIGTSLYRQFQEQGFHLLNEEPISSDRLDFAKLKEQVKIGVQMYLNEEVGTVQVLYTKFINTMKFEPAEDVLLPCEAKLDDKEPAGEHQETLFEPDPITILDQLIPMMIEDAAYSDWMESTTSEQGSRRVAMKNATDNEDDLSESLMLEYNKARQAAITQEITEIVSGSNAV